MDSVKPKLTAVPAGRMFPRSVGTARHDVEEETVTGWAAVLTAVSTAVMAIAVVVFVVALVSSMRRMIDLSKSVERLVDTLDRDARPALQAVRRTADEASRLAILVRDEVDGITGTSKNLRGRIERTTKSLEERFIEFETLLDLLQDEVEETALDVAAALRTTRRGAGLFRTMRRVFKRRKR